ncbi:MAG: D-glycero-beta-D-manno-heptose 1-phosphate adenylyltransferase [Candidatus Eisenbacteria bacterium]
MNKIVTLDQLRDARETARKAGKRFVFTNGCFDILHRGHVELLRAARNLGDQLAVGINSDDSVRRLKGEKRPIVLEDDRTAVVAALESVDFVTVFDEDTPERVITVLLPDVLVKGGDYAIDEIVGRKQVEESGGKVVRLPLHGGHSTAKLLRDIAERYKDTPEAES